MSTEIEAMQGNPSAAPTSVGQVGLRRSGDRLCENSGITVHVDDAGVTAVSMRAANHSIGVSIPQGAGVDWSDVEDMIDSAVLPDLYDDEIAILDAAEIAGHITGQERAALAQEANARRTRRNNMVGVINSQKAKLPNEPPGQQGAESVKVRPR
jgi:hypothetical protein